MVDYTPNMKLVIPVANQTPWTEDMDGNLSIIDSVVGQFIAIPGFSGAWDNSVAYTVGQVVVEVPASTIWNCNITHTSAGAGTFAADRTANPTYWTLIGGSGFVVPDAVKKSGDSMSGLLTLNQGLSFGGVVGSSNTDASRHILLYSTTYGISIANGAMNLFASGLAGSAINLIHGTTIRFQSTPLGASVFGVFNVSGKITTSGGLDVGGTGGVQYTGIAGGTNAIGFVWTGTQLDAYVNGTRVGRVTLT